jgi:tetratricopeptide (TPR) repeat protein
MEKDAKKINTFLKENYAAMTNRELVTELARQGIVVTMADVQAALRRLGLSREISGRGALPGRIRSVETLSLHKERSRESAVYAKAVAEFEKGLDALRKKRYAEAAKVFASLKQQYAQERELADRARSYRRAAEEQAEGGEEMAPRGFENTFHAALLCVNQRDWAKAGPLLEKAMHGASGAAQKARVHYAMATMAVYRDERAGAMEHLRQAVEGDSQFRIQLRDDVDFRPLRDEPVFKELTAYVKKSA